MMNDGRKILIVDDERPVRDVFEETFSRAGYAVQTADSGERALRLLAEGQIRVMFLDLKLTGMDGMELARQIRKHYPDAIMYAITGYADEFDLSGCCQAGFNGYFLKPVKLEDLYRAAGEAFLELEQTKGS